MHLPPGYLQQIEGDVTIISSDADLGFVSDAVARSRSLHAFAAQMVGAKQLRGRGAAYAIPANGTHWVVRHYRRGGAIASLLGDRYARTGSPRPLAELIVSEAARARGIATPRVAAAVIYRAGAFYRGDLATQCIASSTDLAQLTLGARPWPDDARIAAWRASGALLRMCFENGLSHPDLNLMNILVERATGGVAAHVIDLDRAHLRSRTTAAERLHMLARFERSRAKIERRTGRAVSQQEQIAFREGLGA